MLRKSIYAAALVLTTLAIPTLMPENADAQVVVRGRRFAVGVGGYPTYYGGYPTYYGGNYGYGYRAPYYNNYGPRYYGGYYGGGYRGYRYR